MQTDDIDPAKLAELDHKLDALAAPKAPSLDVLDIASERRHFYERAKWQVLDTGEWGFVYPYLRTEVIQLPWSKLPAEIEDRENGPQGWRLMDVFPIEARPGKYSGPSGVAVLRSIDHIVLPVTYLNQDQTELPLEGDDIEARARAWEAQGGADATDEGAQDEVSEDQVPTPSE
jgi:hypothetical protein